MQDLFSVSLDWADQEPGQGSMGHYGHRDDEVEVFHMQDRTPASLYLLTGCPNQGYTVIHNIEKRS